MFEFVVRILILLTGVEETKSHIVVRDLALRDHFIETVQFSILPVTDDGDGLRFIAVDDRNQFKELFQERVQVLLSK